jgi:hypothetical protein
LWRTKAVACEHFLLLLLDSSPLPTGSFCWAWWLHSFTLWQPELEVSPITAGWPYFISHTCFEILSANLKVVL